MGYFVPLTTLDDSITAMRTLSSSSNLLALGLRHGRVYFYSILESAVLLSIGRGALCSPISDIRWLETCVDHSVFWLVAASESNIILWKTQSTEGTGDDEHEN